MNKRPEMAHFEAHQFFSFTCIADTALPFTLPRSLRQLLLTLCRLQEQLFGVIQSIVVRPLDDFGHFWKSQLDVE